MIVSCRSNTIYASGYLDVRQEVLLDLSEFQRDSGTFLLRHFPRPSASRSSAPIPLVEPLGTRFGSRLGTIVKAETTDYVRGFRRACDWQQRCHLR